jgi:hypothetical protein
MLTNNDLKPDISSRLIFMEFRTLSEGEKFCPAGYVPVFIDQLK